MNYGMYLSAAGALTNLHRQDVIANNLANVNTVGFKPDMVFNQQRLPARLEAPFPDVNPQWLLEKLGGGNFVSPTQVSTLQGSLETTQRPLDVAIQGNGFFVVAGDDPNDPASQRLTRDGRFELNSEHQLVLASTGQLVLGPDNQPITLQAGAQVSIDTDGTIRQDGESVAQLALVQPTDPTQLRKVGHNMLALRDGMGASSLVPADGRIHQGHVERSAADPITTLNQLIAATKAVQSNTKLMQHHDKLLEQAIGTFGRVA